MLPKSNKIACEHPRYIMYVQKVVAASAMVFAVLNHTTSQSVGGLVEGLKFAVGIPQL